jgi:hypothetical protein
MSFTSNVRSSRLFLWFAMTVVTCFLIVAHPGSAAGQWTTNGNNINNTNSGNVGVGTTTPAQKLDVAGSIASSGTTVIDSSRNITNAGTGSFSGTVTSGALNPFVANSSNAVLTPPGTPAIGLNAQRFDQYVNRSAIGGLFGQYIHPTSGSNFYTYGVWARVISNGAAAAPPTVSETIGVLAESWSMTGSYSAGIKTSNLMSSDYFVNGTVLGVDVNVGRMSGVTLTQNNNVYGVRSIATSGANYGNGDTVYGVYASGSGGTTNYGVYSAAGTNYFNGNIGIGTTTPTKPLDVVGDINASGTISGGTIKAKYQDIAEWVGSSQQLTGGTVVILDPAKSNQVIASVQSYDSRVAGVISPQPGVTLGEEGEGRVLVATTGRVKVKVDASNGPIQIGDLLVTSDKAGVAMKSSPVEFAGVRMHRPGTLIGKALEPLAQGTGEILVLLSLQ